MMGSVYSRVGDSSCFAYVFQYYGNLGSFKLSGLLVSIIIEISAETTSIMSDFLLDKNALTNPNNKE